MAGDGRSKSYQCMLAVASQRWAAECYQHAMTWRQPHWFEEKKGQNAVIREQLLAAFHAKEARERLFAIIDGEWLPV